MDTLLAGKSVIFCYKILLMKLNFQDEVSVMEIACFIFLLFKLNALLFSY